MFPSAWQSLAKRYVWTLINFNSPTTIHASGTPRLALRSITNAKAALNRILGWFDAQGISDLRTVDGSDYDNLLTALLTDDTISRDLKGAALLEVRRLWSYRDLLPLRMQLPPPMPWYGSTNQDLLGRSRQGAGNRTPRIADETIEPLVVWAGRFVEDLAPDIVAAYREWSTYSHGRGTPYGPLVVHGNRRERLRQALDALSKAGRGIPTQGLTRFGAGEINWTHLGRLAHAWGDGIRRWDSDLVASSGLRLDDGTYLLGEVLGKIDDTPWRPNGISFHEATLLADHLMTAVFILIAYLSGMRPGEVLNLERGCLSYDPDSNLWLISGRHFKGVRDANGALDTAGQVRPQPWVVHSIVSKAINVLEELHDERLLFPRTLKRSTQSDIARTGRAITSAQSTAAITSFIKWVNDFCKEHGRNDYIPKDTRGLVSPSRFRRTLAWHIVRRPRGLVAAAIQYGHVWVQITQGYAGTLESGFADEIAFERWLERIDEVRALDNYLDRGGHISGPAASELATRVSTATHKFAGRTVATLRQAQRLLDDASVQIFAGHGMHCVFDSSRSLCVRDEPAPRLSNCKSGCPNLIRTDDDVAQLRDDLQDIKELIVLDQLAPSPRWHRLDVVAEQLTDVIQSHEGERR